MRILMKKIMVGLLVLTLFVNTSLTTFASGEEVTPSGVAFKDVGEEIEKWAEENQDAYVAFNTAVFCKDELLYQGAFGYADRENNIAADADTVYEWGSITKTLVWVSVMQLWEQGKLDFETDIREYLPEGFFKKLKYDDPITMMNLMNHNAGWCENVWAFFTDDEKKIVSLEESIKQMEPAQVYRPGEVSSYCNYGAALAGYIVECISGQPFSEYVQENIFEPLGMEHTAISPAHDDNPWVYEKRKELVCYSNTLLGWKALGPQLIYVIAYPAGSTTGTIEDLAIYAGSLVSDDCPLFEREETRELLFSPSLMVEGTDIVFGYHGFVSVSYGDKLVLGHDGATLGCSAYMLFEQETGVGTVVMMTGSGLPLTEIPKIVLGEASGGYPSELENSEKAGIDISGTYIGARSMRHGPLKLISCLSILPITASGNGEYNVAGIAQIKNVSGDFYWLTQGELEAPATGYQLEDGTKVFSLGLQSYVQEPMLFVNLALTIFYAVCAVTAGIMLFVKLIMLLIRKFKKYPGAGIIAIAQMAKIVSVGIVVFWIAVFSSQYGLTKVQGIIGCIIQMLCLLSYILSTGVSVKALMVKGEKFRFKIRYILNIIGNVLCAVAVLALELVRFWNV